MVILHIVHGTFAVVLLYGLFDAVGDIGFLKQGVSDVLLVSQHREIDTTLFLDNVEKAHKIRDYSGFCGLICCRALFCIETNVIRSLEQCTSF